MNGGHNHHYGQGLTLVVLWVLIALFSLVVEPVQSVEKQIIAFEQDVIVAFNIKD